MKAYGNDCICGDINYRQLIENCVSFAPCKTWISIGIDLFPRLCEMDLFTYNSRNIESANAHLLFIYSFSHLFIYSPVWQREALGAHES